MWTTSMTSTWLAGFTVCLSLIVSIGAQNLYVLRQAVSGEHVRACVAWCVFSD
ncbi:MAG: amino acid transporter, partial [Comamonas sp.]|nr:amino acid transporter [Comamonas sp.]